MSIDFPASPSLNQEYTYFNRTWKWDGTGWQLVTNTGPMGPTGPTGPLGPTGPRGSNDIVFFIPGVLVPSVGQVRWYFSSSKTVTNVVASVSIPPYGASAIFNVKKNTSTIFTNQANRPTIVSGSNTDLISIPNITSFASGDYLTVDVDQVGTTSPGIDAIVRIEVV